MNKEKLDQICYEILDVIRKNNVSHAHSFRIFYSLFMAANDFVGLSVGELKDYIEKGYIFNKKTKE